MNKIFKGAVFLGLGWLAISAIKKRKAGAGVIDYPNNEVPTPMPIFIPPADDREIDIAPDGNWSYEQMKPTKGGLQIYNPGLQEVILQHQDINTGFSSFNQN